MSTNNFYKKGPVGCLLVHGFTGSPNEWMEMGEFLKKQNFTVSIPTLPGHVTHSADLFNYTWRDWFNCVKDAYEEISKTCQEVFVCGLSMGGTLALHLAAHKPVHAVISLSTPASFPRWKKAIVKILKGVKKFRYKSGGEDVRDRSAKPKLGSYQRYPYYAAGQLFQLVDHVREDLPEIAQPVLIVHSRNDHTISFRNSAIIFAELGSNEKWKVDLERSYHVITVDVEKERVRQEILNFIKEQSKILHVKSPRKVSGSKKKKVG